MKKKNREKQRLKNLIAFVLIALLVLIILGILLALVFLRYDTKEDEFAYNEHFYQKNSRVDNILESKKTDEEDYNTIGWLQVQGTNIDVPILMGINGKFKYPVEKERYGWMENIDTKYHNVLNVLGHNIFNLGPEPKLSSDIFKRFEELMGFVYYDFAKENEYIQLTIDNKEYVYKIFSVSFLYTTDVNALPEGDYTDSEKRNFLKLLKENSIYDYDIDVDSSDDIISVSTCTRLLGTDAYRDILVSGRLVRNGEKFDNYKVTKNDKYKEIDKILRGDDVDEKVGSA